MIRLFRGAVGIDGRGDVRSRRGIDVEIDRIHMFHRDAYELDGLAVHCAWPLRQAAQPARSFQLQHRVGGH